MRPTVRELFNGVARSAGASLNEDFGGVRLNCGPARAIGGIARTVSDEISLSHEAARLPTREVAFILAHELAHVAQKRRGTQAGFEMDLRDDPRRVAAIEHEADDAATRILCGRPATCVLADAPGRPAFWGELGHYYTSYYVMLAAGVDPTKARIRAFFCQLPDEVWQFDATAATRDINEDAPSDSGYGLGSYGIAAGTWFFDIKRATPDEEFAYKNSTRWIYGHGMAAQTTITVEDPAAKAARMQRNLAVIKGLHCLTGEGSQGETAFRLKALVANWSDPVQSGLALHPFGDSFAHRTLANRGVMYGSDHGHALDMHAPDHVSERPDNYLAYAEALYDAVPSDSGPKRPFSIAAKPTLKALTEYTTTMRLPTRDEFGVRDPNGGVKTVKLTGEAAEVKGLAGLKAALSRMTGYDGSYAPENEGSLYWKEFAAKHKARLDEVGGQAAIRAVIVNAGQRWHERKTP